MLTTQVGLFAEPARVSTQADLMECERARELYNKEVLDSGGEPVMEEGGTLSVEARCV